MSRASIHLGQRAEKGWQYRGELIKIFSLRMSKSEAPHQWERSNEGARLMRRGLVAVKYLSVRKYFKGCYQLQTVPPSNMVRGKSFSETDYEDMRGRDFRECSHKKKTTRRSEPLFNQCTMTYFVKIRLTYFWLILSWKIKIYFRSNIGFTKKTW